MCSIEILQLMADINSNINKLSLDRFDVFSRNSIKLLRKVDFLTEEGKEEPEIQLDEPNENVYNNTRETFIRILSLIYKDNSEKNRARITNLLAVLEDVINGFPGFKKQLIDKNTQDIVDETIDMAKRNNDSELPINIIRCKNLIFREI